MKKSAKNRIIIWSAVSVVLVGILIAGMLSLRGLSLTSLYLNSIEIGTDLSSYERGNADFDEASVERIEINWASGEVSIKQGNSKNICIYEDTTDDKNKMYYKLDGGTLKVYGEKNSVLFGITIGEKSKHLTVEIPKDKMLDKLEISSASADINLENCNANDMNAVTASGGIELLNVKGTTLDVNTVSGEINTAECDFGYIEIETTSGEANINTYSSCAEFSANSVSGGVTVNFADIKNGDKLLESKLKTVDIEAVSGSVELNLPSNIKGFTAELESVSGSKNIDFNCKSNEDKTVFGNGETKIDIQTVSGDMEINKTKYFINKSV